MNRSLLVVSVFASLVSVWPVAAQQGHSLRPVPADPEHPATQVATAVAEAVLTADAAAAVARVAPLAAPGYRDGALHAELDAQVARVGAAGRYRLDSVMLATEDSLLVLLRDVDDATRAVGFLVTMEMDAPHQITGLRAVQLQQHAR